MKKFVVGDMIAVKNKEDVLKAAELLEKVGINIFSTDERNEM